MTDQSAPQPKVVYMAENSWVVRLVSETLRDHGTDKLMPDDEFGCCAEAVVLALRNNGVLR